MRTNLRRSRWAPLSLAGAAAVATVAALLPLPNAPSAAAAEPVVVVNHTFEGTTHGWTPRADEKRAGSKADEGSPL